MSADDKSAVICAPGNELRLSGAYGNGKLMLTSPGIGVNAAVPLLLN